MDYATSSSQSAHQADDDSEVSQNQSPSASSTWNEGESAFTVKSKLTEPPEVLVLNWSFLADQVVPPSYERDFVSLEPVSVRKAVKVDGLTAAVSLHQYHEAEATVEKSEKRAEDQFLLAARNDPHASGAGSNSSTSKGEAQGGTQKKISDESGWRV